MDIKELVEWVADIALKYKFCDNMPAKDAAKQILSHPNLALIIREGDTVPLGVEIGTHLVILLKEALKEATND